MDEENLIKPDSCFYGPVIDERKACPVTTRLERRLIIILVIVILVGICLSIALASYSKGNLNQGSDISDICFTPQCISTAANLLHSIDFTKDPCDDFYSFACGNWIKNSYLVGDIITQFSQLNSIITLRVKEFLSSKHQNMAVHEQKVKDFYDACMDMDARDEAGTEDLWEDLKYFGGWPLIQKDWNVTDFNWTETLVKFFEEGYPKDMLLTTTVENDAKNTSTSLISVHQPSLFLDRAYYMASESPLKDYKNLILAVSFILYDSLDLETAIDDIEKAVKIEQRLAKTTIGDSSFTDFNNYYNIQTLKELEKFAPKIPWRYLLTSMLPKDTMLEDDERIMISNPAAVLELNKILEEIDNSTDTLKKKDLANFMFYRIVLFSAQNLGLNLFTLSQNKLHYGSHWQVCVGTTLKFFHMSLTASYAERYLDNETKRLLETMFQDIRDALLENIKAADWLDEETSDKALLKVKKLESTIAYRDEMLDEKKMNTYYDALKIGDVHFKNVKAAYSFQMHEKMEGLRKKQIRNRWENTNNLLRANSFYLPTQNSIIIPIGILYETFFSSGRPNYINYGSLGGILGHEFTHAFDDEGSMFDEEGNYNVWWTNKSYANFMRKVDCYVKQYDKYYESHIKTHINGTITLSENMADNGGLLAAYDAYIGLLNRIGKEKILPGLPFNERQMFWISYASVWCRKQTENNLEFTIQKSVHAPSKFRVIGTLSNSKEFSEDFNCKAGSPLNPELKCSLWTQ